MAKRKYKRGKLIESIADFEKSRSTYFIVLFGQNKERTIHWAFLVSWQYYTLSLFVRARRVYEADLIEEVKSNG